MVIKLVLAQIQFLTVLIVASVVLFPFISGGALALWSDNPLLVSAASSVCLRRRAVYIVGLVSSSGYLYRRVIDVVELFTSSGH